MVCTDKCGRKSIAKHLPNVSVSMLSVLKCGRFHTYFTVIHLFIMNQLLFYLPFDLRHKFSIKHQFMIKSMRTPVAKEPQA
jgi:hypothetical protein